MHLTPCSYDIMLAHVLVALDTVGHKMSTITNRRKVVWEVIV